MISRDCNKTKNLGMQGLEKLFIKTTIENELDIFVF